MHISLKYKPITPKINAHMPTIQTYMLTTPKYKIYKPTNIPTGVYYTLRYNSKIYLFFLKSTNLFIALSSFSSFLDYFQSRCIHFLHISTQIFINFWTSFPRIYLITRLFLHFFALSVNYRNFQSTFAHMFVQSTLLFSTHSIFSHTLTYLLHQLSHF